MIGTWHSLVLDCEDPEPLARFYEQVLGMDRLKTEPDWITIGTGDRGPGMAFQRVDKLVPPQWPDPEHPQQMHPDVQVADLDDGDAAVLGLGAVKHGYEQPDFRVFIDPAGHPFCLVLA